jgi:hypothetical protein
MPAANERNDTLARRSRPVAGTGFTVLATLVACAAAVARPTAGGYTDPRGDANGGPDITRVAISDARGIVTLKVTVSGMKIGRGGPAKGATFYVGLDTDKNGKSNYFLDVYTDATGVSWDIEGATEKVLKQTPTMSFFSSGNTFTFKLGSGDMGGATGFDYYVSSAMQDAASGKRLDGDDAPDGGRFSYALTSVKAFIGAPSASRPDPLAGKSFVLTFPVTRSDSGDRLTSGELTAAVTVGGVALKPVARFEMGTIVLSLTVPRTAKGKPLSARVKIDFAGKSATKSAGFRVG